MVAVAAHAESGFSDWLKRDREARDNFARSGKAPVSESRVAPRARDNSVRDVAPKLAEAAVSAGEGWLIMVYMAGDNNLDPFALADVKEMQKVGSSDKIKIVVLMDRVDYGDWTTTRRFLVRKPTDAGGRDSWEPELDTCDDLGELNMGDPAVLQDFVRWADKRYPQPNRMLILWNHGGGWRSVVSKAVSRGARSSVPPPKPALSQLARGIAWDDTNGGDFLEMREVRSALEPFKPFSVIGTDACLMGMLEVAYELRESCACFIGSEDIEPGDGWPYNKWLPVLLGKPGMAPEDVCRLVVDEYYGSYGSKPVTMSAVRQQEIPVLAKRVDALACALIDYAESGGSPAVSFDRLPWFSLSSPEFVDLGAFLDRLSEKGYPDKIRDVAKAAKAALKQAVVINRSHKKLGGQGLSIYPGGGHDDRDYRAGIIQFARDTRWDEFLRERLYQARASARSALSAGTPRRWAVLIGVEAYSDQGINNLNYAVDDIEKLRDVLIKYAGYKPDHIRMLKNGAATAANVRSVLGTWLPRQVADQDMVLIYFSGHGGAEPALRGGSKDGTEKYMMLADSKADDMYGTAIPMSELARIFGRIRADKLLFAMDSCYSGAAGKGVLRHGMKSVGLSDDYLGALTGSSGTVVLTASRASEVSMESVKLGMGLFSHYVCEALSGGADSDKDGLISVIELFQYLNAKVPVAAKNMGSLQHPVIKGEISGTFPIAVVKESAE
jgi:hypothetical protein